MGPSYKKIKEEEDSDKDEDSDWRPREIQSGITKFATDGCLCVDRTERPRG